jgi:hypothetical protein
MYVQHENRLSEFYWGRTGGQVENAYRFVTRKLGNIILRGIGCEVANRIWSRGELL